MRLNPARPLAALLAVAAVFAAAASADAAPPAASPTSTPTSAAATEPAPTPTPTPTLEAVDTAAPEPQTAGPASGEQGPAGTPAPAQPQAAPAPAPSTPTAPAPTDRLLPGQRLTSGQQLTSPDGRYRAVMQGDGSFVLYGPQRTVWHTGTWLSGGTQFVLQGDGNLVVYTAAMKPVWDSRTWGKAASYLALADTGNLVLIGPSGTLWSSPSSSVLGAGERLQPGERIVSPDNRFQLAMQGDGNLVLYGPGRWIWATMTGGPGNSAVLQGDGNLVVYDAAAKALWDSRTRGTGTTFLALQSDSNLVLYAPGRATWSNPQRDTLRTGEYLTNGESMVSGDQRFRLTLQGDGNLVAYGPTGAAYWANYRTSTKAALQGDGNFVTYYGAAATWSTATWATAANQLVIQSDGNVVLYQPGRALWAAYYVPPRDAALDSAVQQAVQYANSRGERASVAVYDRQTGYFYAAGDYVSPYASASVVKVAIAGQLLVTGQMAAVEGTAWDMIVRSNDDAASALYGRVGGDGVMRAFADRYGLGGYFGPPPVRGWWGITQITAEGIARLYAAMANDPVVGPWLMSAMGAAQCAGADGYPQCFGIPAATGGWRIKQGWTANDPGDGAGYIHSTGFVQGDRYTVAILTSGSAGIYGSYGNVTASTMAQILMPGGVMA